MRRHLPRRSLVHVLLLVVLLTLVVAPRVWGIAFDDIWQFDEGEDAVNPPGPRYGHTAVVLRNKLVLWGGHDGKSPLNDLWVFDPETDEWVPALQGPNTPPARALQAVAQLLGNRFWIFGGEWVANGLSHGPGLQDTWEFVVDEPAELQAGLAADEMPLGHWEERAPMPAPLVGAAATTFTDAEGNLKILVYGGRRDGEAVGDAFLYDVATNVWQVLELQEPTPGPRAGHTLVTIENAVFLFGGDDTPPETLPSTIR